MGTLILFIRHTLVATAVAMLFTACRDQAGSSGDRIKSVDVSGKPKAFQAAYQEQRTTADLAKFYHANNYLPEAAILYRKLIEREPANARWPYLLALIKQDTGATDEAIQLLATSSTLDKTDDLAVLRQAELLRKSGRDDLARAKYQQCLTLQAHEADALLGLAMLAIRNERWSEAEEHLLASLQKDARMVSAYKLLSTVFGETGRDNRAKEASDLAYQYGRQTKCASRSTRIQTRLPPTTV